MIATPVFRDATPADGPTLDAMARASWIETFGHSSAPSDLAAYLAEAHGPNGWLLTDLADPAIRFHLAMDGDEVAGFAKLARRKLPAPDPAPGAMELRQLYVLRAWHGSGIAQRLMAWAVAQARREGATELYLSVWEENTRARSFYARHGFEHVGDYDFHVGTQVDRDLVLRLKL